MSWTNNPLLLSHSATTPCGEIFQTVCDELGRHYVQHGFAYSRTRPKLVYKDKQLKVEICFWSSRSNMPGQYVSFEILPNFYAVQLAKENNKGLLFGHTALFIHKYTDDTDRVRTRQIYGDEVEWTDVRGCQSRIVDNHYCNIYGIDATKFNSIIAFIDTKIIPWIMKIQTAEGIAELLHNASDTRIGALDGKYSNSAFVKYVQTNFPDIDVEAALHLDKASN